jgi:HK97 family phage major capsid protein
MSRKSELQDKLLDLKTEAVETMQELDRIDTGQRMVPAGKPTQTPGVYVGDDLGSNRPWDSFGEQLLAVRQAGTPGGVTDPRLLKRATGLGETVPSEGGYLVGVDYSQDLLDGVFQTGLLPSMCNRFEISGPSNKLEINAFDETARAAGSRLGGIRGYWADEASEKTASKPKFRKIKLSLNKLIGLCYSTDELLQDSAVLERVIRRGFSDEFGFMLDDAIINGSGVGQPLGITQAGCLTTVSKESGQTATTIVYENLTKMWSRLLPGSERTAVWLYNKDCLPQLATVSIDGSGNSPVFTHGNTGSAAGSDPAPSRIFGRPAYPSEMCATLGTQNDILLCDFSNYILAVKGGMQSDMSIHVRFIYDESVFRFVMRVDGQPVLRSAITPYKSSTTLSHFIRVETRS